MSKQKFSGFLTESDIDQDVVNANVNPPSVQSAGDYLKCTIMGHPDGSHLPAFVRYHQIWEGKMVFGLNPIQRALMDEQGHKRLVNTFELFNPGKLEFIMNEAGSARVRVAALEDEYKPSYISFYLTWANDKGDVLQLPSRKFQKLNKSGIKSAAQFGRGIGLVQQDFYTAAGQRFVGMTVDARVVEYQGKLFLNEVALPGQLSEKKAAGQTASMTNSLLERLNRSE